MLNRRQFLLSSAALAALTALKANESKQIRLWLKEVHPFDDLKFPYKPTIYRDVPAERIVLALKPGDMLNADQVHRAGDLVPGDGLFARRCRNGDEIKHGDIWVICRVEML